MSPLVTTITRTKLTACGDMPPGAEKSASSSDMSFAGAYGVSSGYVCAAVAGRN